MSQHTWKIVTVALLLTAGAVITKSFMSAPAEVEAQPAQQALAPRMDAPRPAAPVQPEPVAQAMPTASPVTRIEEPAPQTQQEAIEPTMELSEVEPGWNVVVVRGDQVQHVTYHDPDAKEDISLIED